MPLTRRSFGNLRQLKSGNWQASYIGPDRQRHTAPTTFRTKNAAEAWLALQNETVSSGKWAPDADIEQFGSYAETWLAARRRLDGTPLSPTTIRDYRAAIAALEPLKYLGLDEITPADVRRLHANYTAESGATTAGRHLRTLRAICSTAYRDGLIPRNPVPSELCRTKTGLRHRPPNTQELSDLIDVIEPRFKLAVFLAAFGGLRIGEWRALRRRDLTRDGDRYQVTVQRQALNVEGQWHIKEPKSESGIRNSALPAWLTEEITNHLKNYVGRSRDALLFPASNGSEFVDTEWKNAWNTARRKVGIFGEVRGHDLRHYYATTLAKAGTSAPNLQSALGHSSIAMSMKYVHASKGATPETADLLQPIK
jgi:integrase